LQLLPYLLLAECHMRVHFSFSSSFQWEKVASFKSFFMLATTMGWNYFFLHPYILMYLRVWNVMSIATTSTISSNLYHTHALPTATSGISRAICFTLRLSDV
jgi:hypothetical protein